MRTVDIRIYYCGLRSLLTLRIMYTKEMILFLITDVPGCGFFLPVEANTDDLCNAPRAVIANLDYPLWHPNQRTTSWVITTSPGTYIALHFTLFNVQSSSANCQYSYLKITSDETSYVLCNNNFLSYIPDGDYYSHRNSLIVEMTVEDNSNATFTATYSEMRFVAYALPSNEGEQQLLSMNEITVGLRKVINFLVPHGQRLNKIGALEKITVNNLQFTVDIHFSTS